MDRVEKYYLRQSEGGFATPGFICNNRKCLENDPLFKNGGIITTPLKNVKKSKSGRGNNLKKQKTIKNKKIRGIQALHNPSIMIKKSTKKK
jgi:hypothetical protein